MVEVGSISIGGSIQTSEIERGLKRVEGGLTQVETKGKSVNADFERMNQQTKRLAKTLGIMAITGAAALIGMAKGAPALAGAMAKIKVSMMKLTFAIGEALKPQFEWFANKLSWAAGWVDTHPDMFSAITTSVVALGTAFLAFKIGGAIAIGMASLLEVAKSLFVLVSSPEFAAGVIALGALAILWAHAKKLQAEARAWNELIPPGMKDIEPSIENRAKGVFPGGTRQFEPDFGVANMTYNFANDRINRKNMTLNWEDTV